MNEAASWVRFEEDGALAVISLNRPETGNAFTGPMFDVLTEHLDRVAGEGRHTVLLLRAEGDDFSIGRERPSGPPPSKPTAAQVREELSKIQRTNEALMRFPGISLAAIQGRALGAGCSLPCRCDLVLAAGDARLGFPEILIKLPPTIVMAYYAKVLPKKAFFDMVVTGREISADEAQRIGLVSRVVSPERLQEDARQVAQELLEKDAQSLRTAKEFWRRLDRVPMEDAADYGINVLANLLASR